MNRADDRPGRANLYRSSRFTVIEPVNGSGRGRLRGVLKTIAVLAAIWLVLAFDYPAGIPSGAEFDHSANGAWIEARWSNALVSATDTAALVNRLSQQGIQWVYANEGTLADNGELDRSNYAYARPLVQSIHRAPGNLKAIAWLSGTANLPLSDARTRGRIVDACKYLVSQLDFDGVQLDIEPLPSGDPDFLKLLDELRAGIGSKTISVAAMKWTPFAPPVGPSSLVAYSWNDNYYHEVASRVDQLAVMTYDSGVPLANVYIKYVSLETSHILDSLRDVPTCRVLIGVPTYDRRTFWHQGAENMGSGLQGVIEALDSFRRAGDLPTNFDGVAIYAEWTTSPEEWALYDSAWHTPK